MFLEKSQMEELLCTLDDKGCIFPGFEIAKVNNRPNLLGTGGFSSVYEMRSVKRPEKDYVVKVIGFDKHIVTSENFWETLRVQRYLAEQIEYVCRVISAKEINVILDDEGCLKEVTEVKEERWNEHGIHIQFILMERLNEIIDKDRFGKAFLVNEDLGNEEQVINFAIQIGQALYCAHSNNILHRDVKLENIFWDKDAKCYKLGDFGLAKETLEGSAETVVYTDGYGAPEIERYLSDKYNATADIYSFGITLYLLLNNLRFPGSEGYYVNLVQYNPEFVFPAPVNASEGMVQIIRKMCEYDQEERYQSMADVLMDLAALRNSQTDEVEEDIELPDFATETYKEEKVKREQRDKGSVETKEIGRAERKETERWKKSIFVRRSIGYFVGFTLLFTILISCIQKDVEVLQNWQFWILSAMVAVEAVLLIVKEFNIIFAMITMITGIYLGISIGFTTAWVIMLGSLVIGAPAISGAAAVSTVLWAILINNGVPQWIEYIKAYKMHWILVVVFVVLTFEYLVECAVYKLALTDDYDDEEEQVDEDEMDNRGDGEYPDTIE